MTDKSKHVIQITIEMAIALRIRNYPGYSGAFTRRRADGAYRNGAAVVKVAVDDEGDLHPIGTRGRVLGSFQIPPHPLIYFVEWDAKPGFAYAMVAWKIDEVRE